MVFRTGLVLGAAALLLVAPRQQQYDTILRGGWVVDGTGHPGFTADVGVIGGTIARIGDLSRASAATDIDARGLVVTPGFVNVHSHANPAALPTAVNMLTQGVTTELLNADGAGPTDLSLQLGPIGAAGLAVNVAASIGFNSIWSSVVGLSDRRPAAEEIRRMQQLIVENLERGAFGVAAGLDYKPAFFARTDEVVAIVEPARRWRTFFPNHDRLDPATGFSSRLGVEETRDIGHRAGLVPQFTHMKVQGHEQGSAREVVAMMERESAAGRWVASDVYPYLAGLTSLAALIIPGWAQDGGVEAMRTRFKDPDQRARIIREADEAIKARFNGPESIMVLGTRPLSDIMKELSAPTPGAAVVSVLETASPWAILGFGIEPDLVALMQYHSAAVACDCGAAAGPAGHPRSYGTYPRVLGRYVREQRIMSWEDAIRKMSGLPAAMMGLVDRGLIAPGMAADIVVFDSAAVIDRATFEQPALLSEGIRHVLVNGRIALRDGVPTGERGGQVLRRTGHMPSRPLYPGEARRVTASGVLRGADGAAGPRVTIALRQPAGARAAAGDLKVEGAGSAFRVTSLGVLQTAAGWASVTGRATVGAGGEERSFLLLVEAADPFVEGAPSTVRLMVDGGPAIEGRLPGRATIQPAVPGRR